MNCGSLVHEKIVNQNFIKLFTGKSFSPVHIIPVYAFFPWTIIICFITFIIMRHYSGSSIFCCFTFIFMFHIFSGSRFSREPINCDSNNGLGHGHGTGWDGMGISKTHLKNSFINLDPQNKHLYLFIFWLNFWNIIIPKVNIWNV